jgi:hypothetical protein
MNFIGVAQIVVYDAEDMEPVLYAACPIKAEGENRDQLIKWLKKNLADLERQAKNDA